MFEEGHKIRKALFDSDKTQVWLISKLAERGVKTDKTEMSSVLKGTRRGNKADLILTTSAEILNDYKNERR